MKWKVTYLVFSASLIWFTAVFLVFGFNEFSLRTNIRWSARFSLISFCLAFGASSFYHLYQSAVSRALLQNRKFIGVAFALLHIIHLLFLLLLHHYFHKTFIRQASIEIIFGGFAYLILVMMFFTSFEQISSKISNTFWKRLHKFGGYYILIVFSNSILGRVIGGKFEYLPLALLILALWLIRFLSWKKANFSSTSGSNPR